MFQIDQTEDALYYIIFYALLYVFVCFVFTVQTRVFLFNMKKAK